MVEQDGGMEEFLLRLTRSAAWRLPPAVRRPGGQVVTQPCCGAAMPPRRAAPRRTGLDTSSPHQPDIYPCARRSKILSVATYGWFVLGVAWPLSHRPSPLCRADSSEFEWVSTSLGNRC